MSFKALPFRNNATAGSAALRAPCCHTCITFFLFFLLVATLSRTKKEITKKILSSCALYTCIHIQYIHK